MEGYENLSYVALNVSDVAKSPAFYEQQVGLQFSGEGEGGITFLRCSEDHHSVALYCSEKPGLKRVGFEMRSEAALDILTQRLADHGTTVTEVSATERKILRLGRALRITEPFSGATFEFYVTMGAVRRSALRPDSGQDPAPRTCRAEGSGIG